MAIIIKSAAELEAMRRAGRVNSLALQAMVRAVRPGITTAELDAIGAEVIAAHGGVPAFLNYPNQMPGEPPFPAATTMSINDELVHGIPGPRRLRRGDILSIDVGTVLDGFVGDSAITVGVGRISPRARRLLEVTEQALYRGIEASRAGRRIGDVSAAIQAWVESHGLQVVREYTGHGVGHDMHEDPEIFNWGTPGTGHVLKPGMTYALEPMVTVGPPALVVRGDGWTVATIDGGLCAHFEHTIAITDGEAEILTL
ncbi:MAG: type I methionyl aminopeptidase [Anaerolineae bacterium]|jgi:methionyl aminopeptidase